MNLRRWAGMARAAMVLVLLLPVSLRAALAQDAPQQGGGWQGGRGQFAGMQRIGGTITAISGPQVTIKTVDGAVYQVVTTDNTRVMRGRGVSAKLADLKPGDGLMAMGNLDAPNKTMHAALLMSVDAEQMKKMEEAHQQELANLGKTLIAGRVTAIDLDNATMTVERPDGVSQTIGFDENTSFRRGRGMFGGAREPGGANGAEAANRPASPSPAESITLADIKVGDRISGPGEVKNGRFVAKELNVMTPGAGRRRRQGETAGNDGQTAGSDTGTQPSGSTSPK